MWHSLLKIFYINSPVKAIVCESDRETTPRKIGDATNFLGRKQPTERHLFTNGTYLSPCAEEKRI